MMRYILDRLDQILAGQQRIAATQLEILRILKKESIIMSDISAAYDALKASAAVLESKDASILAYVEGIPKLITDAVASASGDNAAAIANINALAAKLSSEPDAILAAINANTTPAPAPAPEAPPAPATPAEPTA